jgi:RHH-type proline utilization regulon transcriptional repressor/proline dehydrogenase/delta 1-pyrroline-5-carboxylate dehydrogenase
MWGHQPRSQTQDGQGKGLPPFRNEPVSDFSRQEARTSMAQALRAVRGQLGRWYPLAIQGREIATTETIVSTDPGDESTVVGRFGRARVEDAAKAVEVARRAFDSWSTTPVEQRSEILVRVAAIMREHRFELAARIIVECAKPWREADGEVSEAIDFCEFYAREMLKLAEPRRRDVPGETNATILVPRGVAVVIAPWNFPLAIPAGMIGAALVAGNPVVFKPSERSPWLAWHLSQIFREAGLPEGVLTLLTGLGDVGEALVRDPRVDVVAFTGSREVGLEINRQANTTAPGQDHVKRVVCEMGGKNALIIDDDADLDEAVVGVLQSAFGYSGQKCSACSRVIALKDVHDAFLARLVEATRALPVGPADDPNTVVGPVIDGRAQARIEEYIDLAKTEGRIALAVDVGFLPDHGHYVGPHIVAEVSPQARIAQEEVFGPVLTVLRAQDLDEALRIANGTVFALTGGIYSRSPAHIDRVQREFRVGNLYINRPITGAQVDRQPFGGFKLSGIGTKAGGPGYLHEFLLPRSITENTLRRGFAPESSTTNAEMEAVAGA